jgi:hypothetical protein
MRRYEVRIEGHLAPHWAAWFDGLAIAREPDGHTALRGPMADQAALHGVLAKVRDLGLILVSVTPLDPERDAGQTGVTPPPPGRAPPARAADAGTKAESRAGDAGRPA